MTYKERQSCIHTIQTLRRLALNIHGVIDVVDDANCNKLIELLNGGWIPVSERLPETDNENTMNKYNVLLWVANKTHPEREPQIYLGKLRQVKGDDGSGNFWGIKTEPCEWTIWGWCYFNEPEVIAWMPLPKPFKQQEQEE